MDFAKITKALMVIALIGAAGIFFFFFRMGQHDTKTLADFPAAYEAYDQAISGFSKAVLAFDLGSAPATVELERKADEALVELNAKASERISSLTRHDAELMSSMQEIADLAKKEVDTLKATQRAAANKNADLDKLAKESVDLTKQRKTAYARFRELAGIKD